MTKDQEKLKTHCGYLVLSMEQASKALASLHEVAELDEIAGSASLKDMHEKLTKIVAKSGKELVEIQDSCKHETYYAGHSHNDDCYECVICGFIDWR